MFLSLLLKSINQPFNFSNIKSFFSTCFNYQLSVDVYFCYYAFKNNYYIVSSTGGDARVIDISGNDLDASSDFVRYAWATINLDKVNVTTWPTNHALPKLFNKYGDRLRIKVWGNKDVITIESRDPELNVMHVLKEFEIPTYPELLRDETAIQNKYRPAFAKK